MELIKLLDRRPVGPKGTLIRWAVFKCPVCFSEIEAQLSNGKRNQSCGCNQRELASKANTKHGDSKKESNYYNLFGLWSGMKGRCYTSTNQDYHYYGGKGIVVCNEWHNYTAFKEWSLDNGYEPNKKLQIDRIDGNKNYCPENCRWVTPKENQRNRDIVKLTENDVLEIRQLLEQGLSDKEISKLFIVTHHAVADIRRGKTWKDIK